MKKKGMTSDWRWKILALPLCGWFLFVTNKLLLSPYQISGSSGPTTSRGVPKISLEIEKVCPASSSINSKNENSPPKQLMPLQEIRDVVKYWYSFNCPLQKTCSFASIGQHLLHLAIQRKETLLTVQVGAMDGKSNDPMYEMFVVEKKKYVNVRGGTSFPTLNNWLPVLIEPVPINYEAMKNAYVDVARAKGLGCAVPINAAVSYDATTATTTRKKMSSCPFCRVNTSNDAPDRCKQIPDWMRLQIGTLDCEYSKRLFTTEFDLCVLQDPLPCSSLANLLREKHLSAENIAILQVDVEGYEYIFLDGFIKETPDELLPVIIHFEHKVMKTRDSQERSSKLGYVTDLLTARGYVLHDEREDYLALRVGETAVSTMD